MPAQATPAAESEIDTDLVRTLLRERHPDLADLPLTEAASGWDNVIFRLGDDLMVRVPRRALSATLVANEQRWLPVLAPRLPLTIPAPIRVGRPGAGYPWSWSICPWLPGDIAGNRMPDDLSGAAADLGGFLFALHHAAPPDAPHNPYRGVSLGDRDAAVLDRVDLLRDVIDAASARALWRDAVAVAGPDRPPVWIHGDLHPSNILVHQERISGVIDFGDISAGDAATDLAVAWLMFPTEVRTVFREAAGSPDDDAWARARGWALFFGLVLLASSADNPAFGRVGRAAMERLLGE